jgi:hypothetical protein
MGIRRDDHVTPLYPQILALTSLTSGGRSIGTVRSRTQAMELCCIKNLEHHFINCTEQQVNEENKPNVMTTFSLMFYLPSYIQQSLVFK